jgi:hypothetical protein
MPLTGHLSDLSLSELFEFFCNQRKSGRLKVLYPKGSGYFFLQAGSVVDAKIGELRGIDAVYYALTLPNAKFEFSGSTEAADRTINQPWTQVVLEGLRRLDEGITPAEAFPAGYDSQKSEPESVDLFKSPTSKPQIHVPAFLTYIGKESLAKRKPLFAAAVVVAVLGTVAAVGVPAGWYNRAGVSSAATQSVVSTPVPEPVLEPVVSTTPDPSQSESTAETSSTEEDAAAIAAKRQRERERAKAREDRMATANPSAAPSMNGLPAAANAGPKRISVTVTYDESGRVTQASGGDASAIRIARQKRFPPGKAGSATVTIPVN